MSTSGVTIVEFSAAEFRQRMREALHIYVTAMGYPAATAGQREPSWLGHILLPGWRSVAAVDEDNRLIAFAYGYTGTQGQWWHEQVRRGVEHGDDQARNNDHWLDDYFELTEIHVWPNNQGSGIGETVLRALLQNVPNQRVLLSTPEGPSRAWRHYRRLGFVDVLRDYRFVGDARPFAVLGRNLPL